MICHKSEPRLLVRPLHSSIRSILQVQPFPFSWDFQNPLMRPPNPNRNGRPSKNGGASLEPHSQTDDTPQSRNILEGQLREAYGRVVYSHKTHQKCADILLSNLSRRHRIECSPPAVSLVF